MAYLTHKLEFSIDPLSDTTPTYTDISPYLIEADWFSGKEKDIDSPQAGGATFRLQNSKPGVPAFPQHQFEPEHASGLFYPNIVPLRRFRWSITADGVSYPQGIYYAQSWQPQLVMGTTYTEVVVSCVDGFGILALYALPRLDTTDAESYGAVIASDSPLAHFAMDELGGSTMRADPGPDGTYRLGASPGTVTNPVLGEAAPGVFFPGGSLARAQAEDSDAFHDAGAFTMECVATGTTANDGLMALPFHTAGGGFHQAEIRWGNASISTSTTGGGAPANGTHHFALTWDGSTVIRYVDGAALASVGYVTPLDTADANDFLYLHTNPTVKTGDPNDLAAMSHAAFYDYALTPTRIAAHAIAALSRGYASATVGTRIATLATNALWSTAGIPSGQITARAEMQFGQSTLDEILETVKAETPIGLFYFDDNGNPDYQPWDYTTTLQATFGEQEIQYDDLGLQYDNELFNQSTVTRDGGVAQTNQDTTSQGQYSVRNHDESGLILRYDTDADLISQTFVDRFKDPMYRIETITLNGAAQNRRTQILTREIGDTIRVKRRGEGGTANPDVITRILGKQKHLDVNRDLRCTWNLSRGFSAQTSVWHLGQAGYSELGVATVLG